MTTSSAAQAPSRQLRKMTTFRAWSARIQAAGRETKLAVAGVVAIAVHLLDDNFLQPQPGTSPWSISRAVLCRLPYSSQLQAPIRTFAPGFAPRS